MVSELKYYSLEVLPTALLMKDRNFMFHYQKVKIVPFLHAMCIDGILDVSVYLS